MARHRAFWVIVAGTVPTAFRSPRRDDLVPTLVQLQRTQPDTQLRWFDGARMWDSPDQAEAALMQKHRERRDRGAGWRPGGSHEDPRARYQLTRDQKRARFKSRLRRPPEGPADRAPGQPKPGGRPPGSPRPDRPQGWGKNRPPARAGHTHGADQPRGKWSPRGPQRRFGPPKNRGPRKPKPPR